MPWLNAQHNAAHIYISNGMVYQPLGFAHANTDYIHLTRKIDMSQLRANRKKLNTAVQLHSKICKQAQQYLNDELQDNSTPKTLFKYFSPDPSTKYTYSQSIHKCYQHNAILPEIRNQEDLSDFTAALNKHGFGTIPAGIYYSDMEKDALFMSDHSSARNKVFNKLCTWTHPKTWEDMKMGVQDWMYDHYFVYSYHDNQVAPCAFKPTTGAKYNVICQHLDQIPVTPTNATMTAMFYAHFISSCWQHNAELNITQHIINDDLKAIMPEHQYEPSYQWSSNRFNSTADIHNMPIRDDPMTDANSTNPTRLDKQHTLSRQPRALPALPLIFSGLGSIKAAATTGAALAAAKSAATSIATGTIAATAFANLVAPRPLGVPYAPLSWVGKFSKSIFGTATMDEVTLLQKQIQNIRANKHNQQHQIKALQLNVNDLNIAVHQLENEIKGLEEKLQDFATEVSFATLELNARMTIAYSQQVLADTILKWVNVISLARRKITSSIAFSSDEIRDFTDTIATTFGIKMSHNPQHGVTTLLSDDFDYFLDLALPIMDDAKEYSFTKITGIPLFINNTAIAPILQTQYVAFSRTTSSFVLTDELETSTCLTHPNDCILTSIIRNTHDNICGVSNYFEEYNGCKYEELDLVDNFWFLSSGNSTIYSVKDRTRVQIHCNSIPDSRTGPDHTISIEGIGVLNVAPGCKAMVGSKFTISSQSAGYSTYQLEGKPAISILMANSTRDFDFYPYRTDYRTDSKIQIHDWRTFPHIEAQHTPTPTTLTYWGSKPFLYASLTITIFFATTIPITALACLLFRKRRSYDFNPVQQADPEEPLQQELQNMGDGQDIPNAHFAYPDPADDLPIPPNPRHNADMHSFQ